MARIIFTKTAIDTLNRLGFVPPESIEMVDFLEALRALHAGAEVEADDEDAEGEPGEAEDVAGEPEDGDIEGEPLPKKKTRKSKK